MLPTLRPWSPLCARAPGQRHPRWWAAAPSQSRSSSALLAEAAALDAANASLRGKMLRMMAPCRACCGVQDRDAAGFVAAGERPGEEHPRGVHQTVPVTAASPGSPATTTWFPGWRCGAVCESRRCSCSCCQLLAGRSTHGLAGGRLEKSGYRCCKASGAAHQLVARLLSTMALLLVSMSPTAPVSVPQTTVVHQWSQIPPGTLTGWHQCQPLLQASLRHNW
mmetsp:Transcript_65107/g.191000  ORF Transcript_65107/g.191000 Transcript_65107/m.191000 type:complete len:222 (+) Transcript_65107:285-950(+)